ncbi:hypothetical protein FPV67DRAFT_1668155 [Lyophyllum atratum]|nr:hypothetical protein FPV67DRAFT_1668155 [Lyophyllum atratum]
MPVVLVDFVNTVPPPVTAALVQLAPIVAAIRHALQIFSWRSSWYDACLAIALWWAVCLLADVTLHYLLPVVLVVILCIPRRSSPPPTTEQSLQNTITDLTTIFALLPFTPLVPPSKTLFHIAALTYVPYLLATYFVSLRVLLALLGTIVLTARAPSLASSSPPCRAVPGSAGPSAIPCPLSRATPCHPSSSRTNPRQAPRFLSPPSAFSSPSMRTSAGGWAWTGLPPSYRPVSPPNAFTLPTPTTVFVADGKGGRVKRTATWHWKEPEWKVVVRRDDGALSRVERPIPEETPTTAGASGTTGSRLLKAAGKMRESGIIGGGSANGAVAAGEAENGTEEGFEGGEEDNLTTDPDGWVYGDNKWEGPSCKGGMGKYTRHRRWTRVAIVSETVEVVEDGPVGIEHAETLSDVSTATPGQEVHAVGTITSSSPEEESPLRQRLRRALSKPSNP